MMEKTIIQGLEKPPSLRMTDTINRLGYLIEIGVTEREPLDCLMRDLHNIQTAVATQEREIDTYRAICGIYTLHQNPTQSRSRTESSDDFIGGAI